MKIAVVPDMNDDIIIRFIELANPETIEKIVIGMIPRREIDWLGDKSRKKFFWYDRRIGLVLIRMETPF